MMNKVILFAIIICILILNGCSSVNEDITIENNIFQTNIEGYMKNCNNDQFIFVYENDEWREAKRQLPAKGRYFIDGIYRGYGMCDISKCNIIENPIKINLIEYIEIGKKESPREDGPPVPDFITKELRGKIKIELDYYTDSDCKKEKTFSMTVNN